MSGKSILAPDLNIRPSKLYVKDLDKVGRFYKDLVMLDVLLSTDSRMILGNDQVPVLELIAKPEYDNSSLRGAGLFHNAILYNSRTDLARVILNIVQKSATSFEGTGDHLVSEAFYFHDPEGNGLELYYDLPREDWVWQNGRVKMDTLYIDPADYIAKNLQGVVTKQKELGHVHLRVGDIPNARKFYVDQLGFDITVDIDKALFVSVGGYHHHLAMNTWMSAGASKRDPGLGLAEIKLLLPDSSSLNQLANRLDKGEVKHVHTDESLSVDDPWGNKLLFSVDR